MSPIFVNNTNTKASIPDGAPGWIYYLRNLRTNKKIVTICKDKLPKAQYLSNLTVFNNKTGQSIGIYQIEGYKHGGMKVGESYDDMLDVYVKAES